MPEAPLRQGARGARGAEPSAPRRRPPSSRSWSSWHGPPRLPSRAVADVGLVGPAEVGDEVIVNVQALDLGLGSGGFDVVHANLTRGSAAARRGAPRRTTR